MSTIWRPDIGARRGPKYKALAEAIRAGIRAGDLKPGEKLAPVRDLAWDLKITPGTVARAYTVLTDAGVLRAEVGRGTFVAERRADQLVQSEPLIEMDSFPHLTSPRPDVVNLISPALPNVGQASLIKSLMAEVAAHPQSGIMHYPNRKAFQPAREAVVHWLRGTPLGAVDHNDVVMTHGGQNGVCLALQSILTGAKPAVAVEQLSYPGFRRAAGLMRADAVDVPMDAHGIIPEALDDLARSHAIQALCTSPEVHNPTGTFTPEARREEIVAVARAHDIQIIEDDCYRMGRTRAPSYRMIAPERGWYVSSISKVLTPALRIGFVVAPKQQVAALRRSAEYGFFGLATPLADLTARMLMDPRIEEVTRRAAQVQAQYVQTCVNHLGRYDLSWRKDMLFVWLMLPEGWRAAAFCQAAAAERVRIRPADDFVHRDANAPHGVRIAINAQIDLDCFEAAIQRLRDLLDNPAENIGV